MKFFKNNQESVYFEKVINNNTFSINFMIEQRKPIIFLCKFCANKKENYKMTLQLSNYLWAIFRITKPRSHSSKCFIVRNFINSTGLERWLFRLTDS